MLLLKRYFGNKFLFKSRGDVNFQSQICIAILGLGSGFNVTESKNVWGIAIGLYIVDIDPYIVGWLFFFNFSKISFPMEV